jgi:hypothetical protein
MGAVIQPQVAEVQAVPLLPAPGLESIAAELRRPAVHLPMPALAGAVGYRVQVSADPAFGTVALSLRAPPAGISLAELPNGFWFVRWRGIDPLGLEGYDSTLQVWIVDALPPGR